MKEDFKQANVFTAASDIQILASKPENPKVSAAFHLSLLFY